MPSGRREFAGPPRDPKGRRAPNEGRIGCDGARKARSDASQARREDRQRPWGKRENPYHCAVCRPLFEPGNCQVGDPANASGFPSTTAAGHAHRVLGGVPILRVEAQKKLPHHAHGRGSQISIHTQGTLTHAFPRCKPFLRHPGSCRSRCRTSPIQLLGDILPLQ
jgi:hypothetical protein